jgi:hypothetical protein
MTYADAPVDTPDLEGDVPDPDLEGDAPDPDPVPVDTPDPDVIPPQIVPSQPIPPREESTDLHITDFQYYLKHEHLGEFLHSIKDPTIIPILKGDFATDAEGNILLDGDPVLERELGLEEGMHAVTAPTGEIVKMFNPFEVTPGGETHTVLAK